MRPPPPPNPRVLSRRPEKPWFSLWNLECQLPRFQFCPMSTPTPSPTPIPYRQPAGPSSPPLKMPPREVGGTPALRMGEKLSSVEDAPGPTGGAEGTWNLGLGALCSGTVGAGAGLGPCILISPGPPGIPHLPLLPSRKSQEGTSVPSAPTSGAEQDLPEPGLS